ncbi:hypothetical protein HPB47_004997 [Ixodes persulcatus]|uniref:Uncharacterized protein n=1 Tax=Ixodes persulcatus TaxID=34615 RepID=A0AC60PE84_IXOPE|nr:hypothetical protein HPB47_004997 [Ixodes persulcatus]
MIDFQAVVMAAGRGSRLTELLTPDCPKYLLPIGNLPMIYYPLCALKKAGFTEVIVIAPSSGKQKIDETLAEKTGLRIDYEFVAAGEDDLGTLQSLRQLIGLGKIKKDLFVVSCDLVTDFDFTRAANLHRTYDAALTVLLAPMSDSLKESPVPGTRGKAKFEKTLWALSPRRIDSSCSTRRRTLRKCKWLMPFLFKNEGMTTIKGELVPLLARVQFKPDPRKKTVDIPETDVYRRVSFRQPLAGKRYVPTPESEGILVGDEHFTCEIGDGQDPIRCYGLVADGAFLVRANTVAGFMEANRQAYQLDRDTFPHIPSGRFDNVLSDKVDFGEKASVRHCVVGQHCRVGAQAKVQDSVLLDGVVVGDGASVQGCVLCGSLEVGAGSTLKNCVVAHKKNLAEGAKHANEVLGTFVEI